MSDKSEPTNEIVIGALYAYGRRDDLYLLLEYQPESDAPFKAYNLRTNTISCWTEDCFLPAKRIYRPIP